MRGRGNDFSDLKMFQRYKYFLGGGVTKPGSDAYKAETRLETMQAMQGFVVKFEMFSFAGRPRSITDASLSVVVTVIPNQIEFNGTNNTNTPLKTY